MATKNKAIDPKNWYSLKDILDQRLLPWVPASYWSVRRALFKPHALAIVKPVKRGTDSYTQYHFKGENLIKLIKAVEAGKVRL